MATLKEAIEKVGVGGKVKKDGYHYEHVVTAVGETMALLKYTGNLQFEEGQDLLQDGWSPVLPKKRVVLQAWECTDGEIKWFCKLPDCYSSSYKRRDDIAEED